jgi:hypothetical protein
MGTIQSETKWMNWGIICREKGYNALGEVVFPSIRDDKDAASSES